MKRLALLPSLLVALPLCAATACGDTSAPDDSAMRPAPPPAAAEAPASTPMSGDTSALAPGTADAAELVAIGELREVDPDSRTLTVAIEGRDETMTFSYDASTAVHNVDGQVQGLSGQDGSAVTVYYRKAADAGARHAERIELR